MLKTPLTFKHGKMSFLSLNTCLVKAIKGIRHDVVRKLIALNALLRACSSTMHTLMAQMEG